VDLEDLEAPLDPGGAGAEYVAAKLEYDKTKKRLEVEKVKIKNLYVIYVFVVLIKAARSRGLSPISTATILNTFEATGTPAQLATSSKALITKSSKYHMLVRKINMGIFASDTLLAIEKRNQAHYGPVAIDLQEIWAYTRPSQAVLTRKYNKALEAWAFLVEDIIPAGSVNLVFPSCPQCGKDNHHESTCFSKNPALLKPFQDQVRSREKARMAGLRESAGQEASAREVPLCDGKMSKTDLVALGKEQFGTALGKPEVDLVTKYLQELMQKAQSTLLSLSRPQGEAPRASQQSHHRHRH